MNDRSLIGQEVAGYYIENIVGKGGMAVVYLALDPRLSRRVALKILNPLLSVDDRFRQRFILESRTVASIEHPNIIPIYEANADSAGVLYIAMRYVDGLDLRRLFYDRGPLPLGQALSIFAQTAAALDAAHAHDLIHRDVKPANILLAGDHVYLTDFGITKHRTSISGLTQTDQFIGTPRYMSPEQINKETVDGRCDQYALACVVYEGLAGRLPFQRDNDIALLWAHLAEQPVPLSQVRPELPLEVDGVMARALAKSPEQRYGTCIEFVTALREAIEGRRADTGPRAASLGGTTGPGLPQGGATGPGVPHGFYGAQTGPGSPPPTRSGHGRLPVVLAALVAAAAAIVLVVLLVINQSGEGWARYQATDAAPLSFDYPGDWTAKTRSDLFAVASPRAAEFEALFVAGQGADWSAVNQLISGEAEAASGIYVQVSDTLSTTSSDVQMKQTLDGLLPGETDITRKPVTDQAGNGVGVSFEGALHDPRSGGKLGFVGYVLDHKPKPLLLLYFCARNSCDDATQSHVRQSVQLR
ncbi:serine/threonine protein kinase [Nonomuraea sp. NBC_01738]|uniref:serine/threonine protein kinase n=1 Tax=Nonomuraea sp. NBC_01738 TaxID=2976003 RepID=UPI002E0EEF5D|nr:serine/threonine protein kinase [Nonomuraea sp. NBC_01738]